MRNFLITYILFCFGIHLYGQEYAVKRNNGAIIIELDNKIVSKFGFIDSMPLEGNYRLDHNSVISKNRDTVAVFDDRFLILNGRTYKFKTPAFSHTNSIVDKTDRKTEVLTIFQENEDSFLMKTSFQDVGIEEQEIIKIWAIYNQVKDILKNESKNAIDPVLMGLIAGLLSTY
jgi:hypothetical protein